MGIRRVYLTYLGDDMKKPIVYEVGHKFDVVTNIRGATIKEDIGLVTLEIAIDRLAATVDHHRLHADRFHENHVQQDVHQRHFVVDDAPAEFDHGRFAAKSSDPAHRLDERIGFGECLIHTEVSKSSDEVLRGNSFHDPREGQLGCSEPEKPINLGMPSARVN